jgi:hypothetical protein
MHPEYKPEWAVGMLETEINKIKGKLKAGVHAKEFQECQALQRQLDILQDKKCDAEKILVSGASVVHVIDPASMKLYTHFWHFETLGSTTHTTHTIQEQFKLAHGAAEKQRLVVQLEDLRLASKELAEVPSGVGTNELLPGNQGSAEIEIEFGSLSDLGSTKGRSPISDKFVANKLIVGQPAHAAHGLADFMGISSEREGEIKQQGLKAIRAEFHNLEDKMKVSGSATDKQEAAKHLAIVLYILDGAACELEENSNDGNSTIVRDKGHSGMRLADFKQHKDAVAAKLEDTHVAALRIYTSQAYGQINGPLRKKEQPHPFAATTLFISEGLKKLRAVHAMDDQATQTKEFWRGMKVCV